MLPHRLHRSVKQRRRASGEGLPMGYHSFLLGPDVTSGAGWSLRLNVNLTHAGSSLFQVEEEKRQSVGMRVQRQTTGEDEVEEEEEDEALCKN